MTPDFDIKPLDPVLREKVLQYIDDLAKPKGALGYLEDIALQLALIQGTLHPELHRPHHLLFCADHGIEEEGVSKSPRAVTWQQTLNFKRRGTAIDFLTRQYGIELVVIDAGIDYDLPKDFGIIDYKIRRGTSNFRHEPAMSNDEYRLCIERGARQVELAHRKGCNIISIGEMGIGNTSPSSIWMHLFTGIPLEQCVGAGSGLSTKELRNKLQVLSEAVDNAPDLCTAEEIMTYFGGFEMVMTVGAMLKAAELQMAIVVDGFIMTVCMLAASRLNPNVLQYALFGHKGDERGHALLLQFIKVRAILDLGMKLGEGTGAVVAFPIIKSAALMMTEMSTFSGENIIEKYF